MIRTNSTDLMALTNVWVLQDYFSPEMQIGNKDIVIDIGAHIGLFSLFASQFCKNGKIYCFEPVLNNYNLLKKNLELNRVSNIITFNKAVSKDSSRVTLYQNEDEAGYSMFLPNTNPLEVDSITLQEIFMESKIPFCNLIKFDCEGAEYEIIDTLPEEYFNRIHKIMMEYHFVDADPQLVEKLIKKLRNNSFKIIFNQRYSNMGILYAVKN